MRTICKIFIGIATFLAVVYILLVLSLILSGYFHTGATIPSWFFILHMLYMILAISLMAFYIVKVIKNDKLEPNKKVMWVLLLFFFNIITMIIYYFLHILGDKKVDNTLS